MSQAGVRASSHLAILSMLLLVAAGCTAHPPPVQAGSEEPLHRLVAILDYIGADYPAAVSEGRILDKLEFEEQIAFARAARDIAAGLDSPLPLELQSQLAELERLCESAAPVTVVAELTKTARRGLVEAFGLVQSPVAPPSAENGAGLYRTHCASCHGVHGIPPPEKAAELKPPPRALSQREVLDSLSPYRVYNALTFGIEGTAMPSFHALKPADRWDLAFQVFRLREDATPEQEALPSGVEFGLARLAASSDAELREALLRAAADPPVVERALDALRLETPYAEDLAQAPIAVARRFLERGMEAAQNGREREAEGLLVDAYLHGIERVEAPLSATDPDLVAALESEFLLLRSAIAGRRGSAAEQHAQSLRRLLGRAELLLESRPGSPWFAAMSGALLVVREGVEAALIVLVLLAAVAKAGRGNAGRWVHAGWIAALGMGVLTLGMTRLVTARVAASAEIVEAAASLAAAAVLFYVSHWILGQVQAARWTGFLKERAISHVSRGRLLTLFGLSFLAVYREAFESVLFFEALVAGGGNPSHVIGGVAAGALVLAVLVVGLRRLGGRLPLRAFFTASGVLLYVLCVILTGHGVRALVAAGAITPRPLPSATVPMLGIYPDMLALAAQALLVLAAVGSVLASRRRGGLAPVADGGAAAE